MQCGVFKVIAATRAIIIIIVVNCEFDHRAARVFGGFARLEYSRHTPGLRRDSWLGRNFGFYIRAPDCEIFDLRAERVQAQVLGVDQIDSLCVLRT